MAIIKIMINELTNIRQAFSGQYISTDSISNELLIETGVSIETPKVSDDKKNMRNDFINVESDYRKAFNERKHELVELI